MYPELTKDRPDSKADEATARAVPQVLRLAMIYALFDQAERIGRGHLTAALALWSYCEASARWLFSTHIQELEREKHGALAKFILTGGAEGRTRTEISNDFFQRNAKKEQISGELAALVHDGAAVEVKVPGKTRSITRYIHRSLRTNETTKNAGHSPERSNEATNGQRTNSPPAEDHSSEFVNGSSDGRASDQHVSLNSLVRRCGGSDCDEELKPDNDTSLCAECLYIARQEAFAANKYAAEWIGTTSGTPAPPRGERTA